MEVDEVTEPSDVLGALVGDTGDVVLVDDELGLGMTGRGFHLMNINDGTVGDPSAEADALAALAFLLVGRPARLARYKSKTDGHYGETSGGDRQKTKSVHEFRANRKAGAIKKVL